MSEQQLVTVAEAAEILGVDVRTIYNYRNANLLATYRVTGGRQKIRLLRSEVEALAAPASAEVTR